MLKAVAATAFKMLVTMIVKVLQILESAICKSIELAGKLAVNALTPGDQGGFQGAISDVFCGDEASEKIKRLPRPIYSLPWVSPLMTYAV